MELISIVIPVYNVEQYLEKCVDSVLNQSYKNLEIILVNDGSQDNGGIICDQFEKKDERIRVIHKTNGGLSDARNVGIDIATGEYITFIDSDDYVTVDYVESLYNLLKKHQADVSANYYQKVYTEKDLQGINDCESDKEYIFTGEEAVVNMCYQKELPNSAWGKLYKRELFREIRFPVGRLYEDLGTIYKTLLLCDKVVFSPIKKYYYIQHQGSIMSSNFSKRKMDRIIVSNELYDYVKDKSRALKKAAISRMFISNIQVLRELPVDDIKYKEEKELVKKNIKMYRKTVVFDKNAKFANRCIGAASYLPVEVLQKFGGIYKALYRSR